MPGKLRDKVFKKPISELFLLTTLTLFFILPAASTAQQPSESEISAIEKAQASDIEPSGEIARIFSLKMGSKEGDMLREKMLPELIGKIVQWTVPVYKVKKSGESRYRVQTKSKPEHVGTFVWLSPRTDAERAFLEGLENNSIISFKGKIKGQKVYNLVIDPAVLVSK